LYISFE